jgi:hypothetical protein
VGEASHHVLTEIGESQTNEMQDTLLSLAKAVANTTAALVLKAKSVASTLPPNQQTSVITSATKCALATSQLVACTKVSTGEYWDIKRNVILSSWKTHLLP